MPGMNGVEATRHIVADRAGTGVLVLTMLEDDESVFAAMRAGARGYLVMGADTDEVIAAITAVGRGEAIFGPTVAQRILTLFTRPLSAFDEQLFPEVSPRDDDRIRARHQDTWDCCMDGDI